MSDLDGQSDTKPSLAHTTESIQSSESGEAITQTQYHRNRNHLGDFTCRTGALICGGDKPHFLFSSAEGWGRFYLTDTQIAAFVEDGSTWIANIVRSKRA